MLQHEFLQLGKLRDHAQPRSTLPLSRATSARFSRRRGSRDGGAHNRAHRLPLGRRKRPKKKKKPSKMNARLQKSNSSNSLVNATSGGSPPLPGPSRIDGRLVCRPVTDVRCRPTSRRTCKQETTAINRGSNSPIQQRCKTKEVRCTLESVCARGTSSGSGGLL